MIRLLVVDDLAAVRQGLRMRLALEPDFCVVGEAGDGITALAQATALRPDVVIMDVEMPELDGIAATEQMRAINPRGAVIMLSIHEDPDTRARARAAGAVAFMCKRQSPEALPFIIRQAAQAANIR